MGNIIIWLQENWIATLITIAATLIGGFIFHWLSNRSLKKLFSKAERTTLGQVKQKICDIIEKEFVDNIDVTPDRIQALRTSLAQKESIDVDLIPNRICILEEVMLRFRDSRQLSSIQKEEYIKQIEEVIKSTKEYEKQIIEDKFLETSIGKLINSIENIFRNNTISAKDKSIGLNKISLLKQRLKIDEINRTDYFVQISSVIATATVMMAISMFLRDYFIFRTVSSSMISTIIMITIIAILIPVVVTIMKPFIEFKK